VQTTFAGVCSSSAPSHASHARGIGAGGRSSLPPPLPPSVPGGVEGWTLKKVMKALGERHGGCDLAPRKKVVQAAIDAVLNEQAGDGRGGRRNPPPPPCPTTVWRGGLSLFTCCPRTFPRCASTGGVLRTHVARGLLEHRGILSPFVFAVCLGAGWTKWQAGPFQKRFLPHPLFPGPPILSDMRMMENIGC